MLNYVFLIASRTGGPLIPLLALKDEILLVKPETKFVIVGIKGGVEEKFAALEQLPIVFLPEVKLKYGNMRSKSLFSKLILKLENLFWAIFAAFGVIYSSVICCFYLLKFRPKLILSTSNFLSVPMIWAAAFCNIFLGSRRIKIAIHLLDPQNTTIKLTKRFADLLSAGFPSMASKLGPKALVTPNPVRRSSFQNLDKKSAIQKLVDANLLDPNRLDKPLFLIFGGGSGAKFINDWVIDNLETLIQKCNVLHLTGFLQKEESALSNTEGYVCTQGLTDLMAAAYIASDLVMCRAGMSSAAELLYLQKPSFIVPIPDSHQEQNAALVKEYFWILDQRDSVNWIKYVTGELNSNFEFWKAKTWDIYKKGYSKPYLELLLNLID
jgi:UDP-N-acetylglucosamine--N-acetylmuramyl-(pentapeptide) pyrophosphoryl-undecaprenol N-acetylglucosamine transferase